jgi:hypothetical protein
MTRRTGRFLRSIRAGSSGEEVVMEWVPWLWEQSSRDPGGPSTISGRQEGPGMSPGPGDESYDVDAWLMELIYRNIAAESWCEICGCRFARRLRVLPAPVGAQWRRQLVVVAKCRGWRHHVHVASVVIGEDRDTVLRPLRATG